MLHVWVVSLSFSCVSPSVIPQSDLVFRAKSIVTLLLPKPWGSVAPLHTDTGLCNCHVSRSLDSPCGRISPEVIFWCKVICTAHCGILVLYIQFSLFLQDHYSMWKEALTQTRRSKYSQLGHTTGLIGQKWELLKPLHWINNDFIKTLYVCSIDRR